MKPVKPPEEDDDFDPSKDLLPEDDFDPDRDLHPEPVIHGREVPIADEDRPTLFSRAKEGLAALDRGAVSGAKSAIETLANPHSKSGAAMQHFGHGASLGLSDELSGAVGAMDELSRRQRKALGFDQKDGGNVPIVNPDEGLLDALVDRYRMERDSTRHDLATAKEDHPYISGAAEFAGGLTVPVPGPGKFAKGTPLLVKAGKYALAALPVGAALGIGNSEGDLTKGEVGKVAGDAALTAGGAAVVGGVLGPAFEGAGKFVRDRLRARAGALAFKAMNGNAKIVNKARSMGYDDPEELERLGRWAMDNGLVPFNGDPGVIAKRGEQLKKAFGEKIGEVVAKADESGQPFSYNQAWSKAHDNIEGQSGLADVAGSTEARKFLDAVKSQQQKTPGMFGGARTLKTDAQGAVNWDDKAPLARKVFRGAVQAFTNDFQDQVGSALGPEELAKLKTANAGFGNAADATEFATDAATRAEQHKFKNKLVDLMLASTGAAPGALLGDPKLSAGGVGVTLLGKYLSNPARVGHFFNAASKAPAALDTGVLKLGIGGKSAFGAKDVDSEEERLRKAQSAFIMGNGGNGG
jgi:hypothetical protein